MIATVLTTPLDEADPGEPFCFMASFSPIGDTQSVHRPKLPPVASSSQEGIQVIVIDGKKLKAVRKQAGVSVQDLAQRAQVSVSYIYAIEAGHRGSRFDPLARIASVLEIDLTDLLSSCILDTLRRGTDWERNSDYA